MALPFLPVEHIRPAFQELVRSLPAVVDTRVDELVNYFTQTWLDNGLWPPSSWSSFQSSVRTNNDVEGWHNRLNRQTRSGKLDLYQLAMVLHKEAEYVDVQAVLVSEDLLRRYQKRRYADVQGRLNDYWEQYSGGELTTSQLLRQASYLIAPQIA